MGLLSGCLGLKKLAFLQERDDRFPQRSQNENPGKPIPATIASLSCLISFLQLSHFLTSMGPGVCDDNLWVADGFQFLDPNRVILQLIVVSAELLRAAHIFVTMVFGFLQNRVELGDDLVDFLLHAIDSSVLRREFLIHSLQNDGSLLCQQFLDLRNDRRLSFGMRGC